MPSFLFIPCFMKKFALLASIVVVILGFHLFATVPIASGVDETNEVRNTFNQDLNTVIKSIDQLDLALDAAHADIDKVTSAFKELRLNFKKVEYLLEYYDADFVKKKVNGANLYWLNEGVPEIEEMAPHGLQVIEELLFTGDVRSNKGEVMAELDDLHKLLSAYRKRHLERPMYDYQIWEAIRYELVRVYTLGLTGFDSPVLLHSIPEAKVVFESLLETYSVYKAKLEDLDPDLSNLLVDRFSGASAYLENHSDFNEFDRLHFLREYVDPIFAGTLEAQQLLRAYIPSKYYSTPSAFNYESQSLFAKDFLNASYYSKFNGIPSPEILNLGQQLFYDPILSKNNKRACASCHDATKAFTDGKTKSLAFDGVGEVDRNAPTLINSAFSDRYFYDFGVENIEDQTEMVVTSHKEFATDYKEVVAKISKSNEYQELFKKAFDIQEGAINRNTLTYALAEYVRSLNAFDSQFDKYARGETQTIDDRVKNGFNLFAGKAGCATCHFIPVFNGTVPPNFTESESEVLGVLANEDFENPVLDADAGRYETWKQNASIFYRSFKTVTVRNVALTAPYMHNGSFSTLEKVVDFYNEGGGKGLGLDVPNQTLPEDPLNLTRQEKRDLVLFMEALTDTVGLTSKPKLLPQFVDDESLNSRVLGGEY